EQVYLVADHRIRYSLRLRIFLTWGIGLDRVAIPPWVWSLRFRMILGYVDVEDRIYDLNFATLRLRVRLETGEGKSETRVAFSQVAGAGAKSYRVLGETDAIAEVSMDHDGRRVPL